MSSTYNNILATTPESHSYMMTHVGTNDDIDKDINYTKDQKTIIDTNKNRLYQRVQHDTNLDIPISEHNTVQNQHPYSVNMLNNHADRGYDYRDYPLEMEKHIEYDPYITWLHDRNLIGKNKSRYNTHYINIDSSYRNISSIAKTSIDINLSSNPLSFDGETIKINISDTSMFSINDKITLNSVDNKQIIVRSFVTDDYGNDTDYFKLIPGKQYMTVTADNNMTINSGLTQDIIDQYDDLMVSFDGFIGDTMTQWYFDTRNYIWSFGTPDPNTGISVFTLKENVYGVSSTNNQVPQTMMIAQFSVDQYGIVTSVTQPPSFNTINSGIRWLDPTNGSGTAPIGLPPQYFTDVGVKLQTLQLIPPILPTSIYTTFQYYNKIQNAIRPIFIIYMNKDAYKNISLQYQANNKTYADSVRIVVPEKTVQSTSSLIGNISLKNLNTMNRMFLTGADVEKDLGIYNASTSSASTTPAPNRFYIKLNRPYVQKLFTYSNPLDTGALLITIYENTLSDVTITYHHYGGIPIKYINANYPVGFTSNSGFHYISDISKDNYITISTNKVGFLTGQFGGNNIYIGLIRDIIHGYPQPNQYIISLENDYSNIVMVKMINSIFPKTYKNITDGLTGGIKNNCFYWQNQDDGDHIYSITIEPGNYNALCLKQIFESSVQQIYRYNNTTLTTQINYITLDIDEKTDKVTFTSYNIYQPGNTHAYGSKKILSTIQSSTNPEDIYYQYPNGEYYTHFGYNKLNNDTIIVYINHKNNTVKISDTVIISGSLNYQNIPAKYLNGSHIITRVDTLGYDITLTNINTDSTLDTSIIGGNEITIYTPNLFSIRFDNSDTFGSILGFRDVGNSTSITPYQTKITNDVLYIDEDLSIVLQNKTGNQNTSNTRIRNNLNLIGPQYILIQCKELQTTRSIGIVKNYFYKILLQNKSDNTSNGYISDSYVDSPLFYNDPLDRIDHLTIDILTPDGKYYDFNGMNHSFVLEIVTYDPIPEATNVRH